MKPARVSWADRGRRLVADGIDIAPLAVAFFIMLIFIARAGTLQEAWNTGLAAAFILFLLLVAWVCTSAIYLARRGTTPGKRLMRLEVVRADGTPLGYGVAFAREGIWKVGAIVLCSIAGILGALVALVCLLAPMLVRADARGLHDLALGTRVQDRAPGATK